MNTSAEIKANIKEALYEFFIENNTFLKETISEIMEDIALGRAIEEADKGDYIDESVIINKLKSVK